MKAASAIALIGISLSAHLASATEDETPQSCNQVTRAAWLVRPRPAEVAASPSTAASVMPRIHPVRRGARK
jgi:hypothetical protein